MLNRQQLVTDIVQNMSAMRRFIMQQGMAMKVHHKGPTHAQMGVLFALSHAPETSVKDLAKCFGMTSSAATQLINSLVRRGWVMRRTVTGDRRRVALQLSAAGHRVLKDMRAKHATLMGKYFEVLSDSELKQLKAIQDKLIAHHRAYADIT